MKNIIVLSKLAGSTVKAERAFQNQIVPLINIYDEVMKEDEQIGVVRGASHLFLHLNVNGGIEAE